MITFRNRLGAVDISADLLEDYRKKIGEILKSTDVNFLDEKINGMAEVSLEAIARYMKRKDYPKPRDIRMLDAHGNCINGVFMYVEVQNGKQVWTPVDRWLDQHDGRHDALFVTPCNPEGVKLEKRKSFIIYPLNLYDIFQLPLSNYGIGPTNLTIVPPMDYKNPTLKRRFIEYLFS